MKNIFFTISVVCLSTFLSSAQSSLIVTDYANGQMPIQNNGIINLTTSSSSNETTTVNIKNSTAITKVYKLKRFDDVLNPGAITYFKMGGSFCFAPTTTLTPISVTLTANETTNDNLNAQDLMFILHLEESINPGISHIRYEIYNINDPSDSFTFTIYYNDLTTSIIENSSSLINVSEIYPNPSNEKAFIKVSFKDETSNLVLTVINNLGCEVLKQNINPIIGENTIHIINETLSNGIYFVTIGNEGNKIVRKFIIAK